MYMVVDNMGWLLIFLSCAMISSAVTLDFVDELSNFKYKLDITGLNFIDDLDTVQSNRMRRDEEVHATRDHYELTDETHGHRARRSAVVMETVKAAQKTGNREELDLRSSMPWKTIQSVYEPTDIIDFTVSTATENIRFFAIASRKNEQGSYVSRVSIYRFNETTGNFTLHQSLPEYAPYELESFKARVMNPESNKQFLAVAGYVDDLGSYPTKVTIYEVGAAPTFYLIKIQELPYRSVRSLKHVELMQTTFLILGNYYQDFQTGRRYSSPSQIMLMRYDIYSNYFFFYSSLPGSGVVDVEVISTGRQTYLMAANHRDNDGRLDVFTYVFLYNEQLRNFEMHQTLATHGARDMEPFVLANEHYVVIANEARGLVENKTLSDSSDVYRLSNGKFELVQNLETFGAVKWKSMHVPNCKQDVLLIYSDQRNNLDQVGIYSFSHDKETFSAVSFSIYHLDSMNDTYRPFALTLDTFSVQDYSTGDHNLFTVIGANDSTSSISVYKLSYDIIFTDSPMDSFEREVMSQISELNDTLNDVKSLLKQAKDTLADAVIKNNEQAITGTKHFVELVTSNASIETLKLSQGSLQYYQNNKAYRVNPNVTEYVPVTQLETNISRHDLVINEVLNNEQNFMYTNVDQVINVSASLKSIHLSNINVSKDILIKSDAVNNVSLSQLFADIVTNDKLIQLHSKKSFSHLSKFSNNVTVDGFINGLKFDKDVVLNGTNQTIISPKLFTKSIIVREDLQSGLINEFDVRKDGVSINESSTLNGDKTFANDTFSEQLVLNGMINGFNISALLQDRVTKSDVQNVTGRKVFSRILSNGDVTIKHLVNGINLTHLMNQLEQISNGSIIFGNKIFEGNVTILGDLVVENFINGLKFPASVMLKTSNQTVTSTKTYTGNVRFGQDLNVEGTVDGLKMDNLVTLTDSQSIYGEKTFEMSVTSNSEFTFNENVTVKSVDLSQFAGRVLTVSGNQTVTKLMFADEVTFYQPHINGTLNGETIDELQSLYQQTLHLHGNQTIPGYKTLTKNASVLQNINAQTVNGFRLPDDFARLSHNQTFTATKIFTESVEMKDLNANGTLNHIYLDSFLDSILYKEGDANIGGSKIFSRNVTAMKNVHLSGTVNGIDLSEDLMLLDVSQDVTAKKYFSHVSFPDHTTIMKEDLNVETTIDGVDLSELDLSGMTNTKNETITGNICFEQTDYNRSVDYINGIDLSALRDDIVTLNTAQTILSEKIFETFIVDGNLNTSSIVDGVDVSKLASSSVLNNENASIYANFTFSKDMVIKGDLQTKLFNNINLTSMVNQVVSKTNNDTIEHIEILGNIHVNNIKVDSINDLHTSQDIVYASLKNQTINGHKSFSNVTAKNLTVHAYINGINLTSLQEMVVYKDQDSVIDGTKTFLRNLTVNTNLSSSGLINGFNLTDMQLVRTEGILSQTVPGKKVFADNVVVGSFQTETVNNRRINEVIAQAVMTNKNEHIHGNITFKNGVGVEQDVIVTGSIDVTGKLNNLNLTEVDERTLKTVGVQTMTSKTIEGNVSAANLSVLGHVNGIDISTDLVTKHTSQVIRGTKSFTNLYFVGDIDVRGLTNGFNMTDLLHNTLLMNSSIKQIVHGEKSFENVHFEKVVSDGMIDGLNITEDNFVTLHSSQQLRGLKIFTENFVADVIILKGLLAGIDLLELNRSIVLLNTEQTLNTPINFLNNKYVRGNVFVTGFVNGIDLSSFDYESPELNDELDNLENALNLTLTNQCNSITHVKSSLLESSFRLDFFAYHQSLPHSDVRHFEPFVIDGVMYIALSVNPSHDERCTQSIVLRREGGMFEFHQYINTADVRKMKYQKTGNNESYLITFNRANDCVGIEGPSQLFKWNVTSKLFEQHIALPKNNLNDVEILAVGQQTIMYLADNSSFSIAQLNFSGIHQISSQLLSSVMLHRFISGNIQYMAVATRGSTISSRGDVNINKIVGSTLMLHQRIPTRGVSSIKAFTAEGSTYLLIASEKDFSENGHSTYNVPIEIYRLSETEKFEWFQSVSSFRAIEMSIFNVGQSIYLVVTSNMHAIITYKFAYEIGFEKVDQIDQDGLTATAAFDTFLAVAFETTSSRNTTREAKILKLSSTGVDPSRVGMVGQC